MNSLRIIALVFWMGMGAAFAQQVTPTSQSNLLLTDKGVKDYTRLLAEKPTSVQEIAQIKQKIDAELGQPIQVPMPKDAGGGYTHEQHKANQLSIFYGGILYQLTDDSKYAEHAKNLLFAYAKIYRTLPLHPEKKEQTPGKLFWQSLNEAVWLVYSIQGFDAIKPYLSEEDRRYLKADLFQPYVDFLSVDGAETFNKIHNHGTWAVAAVGMAGYSLEDENWVKMALYGTAKDQSGGFIKQLDQLFSPDGYYSEGPYYQRYALLPFVVFAQAVAINNPELKIFDYRDSILIKAIYAAIDLTYGGFFFPINDALKEKNLKTSEMVFGVDIAYSITQDPRLLSFAKYQGNFAPIDAGFEVAQALSEGKEKPFAFQSKRFRDGEKGDQGGLAIFRAESEKSNSALVYKYTAQGMGHGHYDKLTWLFYDNGEEVIRDYGAARFLNIEAKYGGHYLPENNSWAKQSIAHNTVVVDEKSHFNGKYSIAENAFPTELSFDISNPDFQWASAVLKEVYPGVAFKRTMFQIQDPAFEYPLILDLFEVQSEEQHQYDLPLHFNGQIIYLNTPLAANKSQLLPLGKSNGYEHLWNLAQGKAHEKLSQFTWLLKDRFYTWSTKTSASDELIMVELGANDPDFNLRSERALILRSQGRGNHYFLSALETHGSFDSKNELTVNASNQIQSLELIEKGGKKYIEITTKDAGSRSYPVE
ncbi:alginate lyase family protein [Algoriphagus sp. H41]|uniref:Alginate lyase family protein n=1 Tax=Algoriphagus oliviformis TaxID=2811231 RepID=A0ABS3C0T4_9BACT|nr:alginate lyase family protein [Algoriphagus oliviformis]MBN7809761.1 alginate lyase family protein [Algoriphagus oliviformis]